MRFLSVKTPERQSVMILHRVQLMVNRQAAVRSACRVEGEWRALGSTTERVVPPDQCRFRQAPPWHQYGGALVCSHDRWPRPVWNLPAGAYADLALANFGGRQILRR